jgi:hypothetical protein
MNPGFPKNLKRYKRGIRFFVASSMVFFLIPAYSNYSNSAIIEIYSSNADAGCGEEFQNKASVFKPGDELILICDTCNNE